MDFLGNFRSCFLVDVKIAKDIVKIEDSCKNVYYVEVTDDKAFTSFKHWFKSTFLKGIAHTVSTFRYETKPIEEGISGMFIKKFLNLEDTTKENAV